MKYLNILTCFFAVFMFSFSYGQTAQEWFDKGLDKYDSGQYEGAIKDYTKAIELKPDFADAYFDRGMAKRKLNQYNEAIKDYDTAIQIDPNYSNVYVSKGVTYHYLEEYTEAIRAYDKAVNIKPKFERAYFNRAIANYALGEYEEAEKDYLKVESINPNYPNLQNNLEQVRDSMADPKIWAMAVGIDKYYHDYILSDLTTSVTAANEFVRILERTQFATNEVLILVNKQARKDSIIKKMKDIFLSPKVGTKDMIVFYFSGHGDELNNGFGVCPYNYDDSRKSLIEDKEIKNILNKSRAKHKICFIESCKSESEEADVFSEEKKDEFNEQRKKIGGGIVFITSTKVGKKSYALSDIGGVFSHFLIEGLRGEANTDKNSVITAQELYSYIKENVKKRTKGKQIPQINEDYIKETPVFIVKRTAPNER